jgi:hypothetical protein
MTVTKIGSEIRKVVTGKLPITRIEFNNLHARVGDALFVLISSNMDIIEPYDAISVFGNSDVTLLVNGVQHELDDLGINLIQTWSNPILDEYVIILNSELGFTDDDTSFDAVVNIETFTKDEIAASVVVYRGIVAHDNNATGS